MLSAFSCLPLVFSTNEILVEHAKLIVKNGAAWDARSNVRVFYATAFVTSKHLRIRIILLPFYLFIMLRTVETNFPEFSTPFLNFHGNSLFQYLSTRFLNSISFHVVVFNQFKF